MPTKKTLSCELADLDEVIIEEAAISQRLKQLGQEISNEYKGRELVVISIINGAIIFTADRPLL